MEILKEITQWEVSYRQPNHTYLVNNKGQIIAYAKWHSNDIMIFKTRDTLNKRYRKFEKSNHSGLSKLLSQFKNEDNQKETKSIQLDIAEKHNRKRRRVAAKYNSLYEWWNRGPC